MSTSHPYQQNRPNNIQVPSTSQSTPQIQLTSEPETFQQSEAIMSAAPSPRKVTYQQIPTTPIYEQKSNESDYPLKWEQGEKGRGFGDDGNQGNSYDGPELREWIPLPLENWALISLIILMILGAGLMEGLFWWSKSTQGWPTLSQTADFGAIHFLYTIPPVAISLPVVGMWAWIDQSVKKLQPYIDLTNGDATAEKTLFLNYLDTNRFIVWYYTLRNQHYLATLSTAIALFTLVVSPLASGLFVVRVTQISHPNYNYESIDNLGLNPAWETLVPFSAAAGFMEAQAMYNITQPSFTKADWTIARYALPTNPNNGTANATTIAIKTDSNCVPHDSLSVFANSTNLVASMTWQSCTQNFNFDLTSEGTNTVFGSGPLQCTFSNGTLITDVNGGIQFGQVAFWVFDAEDLTSPKGFVAICEPSMQVLNALASVDLTSQGLISAEPLGNITGDGNNVTGAPLNGVPYNGLGFNLTGQNEYVQDRANSTTTALATAVLETLENGNGGLEAAFENQLILGVVNSIYTTYLGLVASKIYFIQNSDSGVSNIVTGTLTAPEYRLWVSPQAAHILAGAFIILAIAGTFLGIYHNKARRNLRLAHEPGTIASAASMAGHSEVSVILEGKDDEKTMRRLLSQHRFRIDPHTGKIVFDGEAGFESAITPTPHQMTFNQGPISPNPKKKRFSRALNPIRKNSGRDENPDELARAEEFRLNRLARLHSFRGSGAGAGVRSSTMMSQGSV